MTEGCVINVHGASWEIILRARLSTEILGRTADIRVQQRLLFQPESTMQVAVCACLDT